MQKGENALSLSVENLSFSYDNQIETLKNLSFSVKNGEAVAVLGKNGAGKTTLFRCILGLLQGYAGSVRIDGTDTRRISKRELAALVSYIPQNHPHTFSYSVEEMVLMGTAHGKNVFEVPGKKEYEAAESALAQMGISHLAKKPYANLSGGEQQLVLAARALAQGGKLLIMDEPTASLDLGNSELLMKQVRTLTGLGYTVLFSTHDPQQALWYSDRVLAFCGGRHSAFGSPDEVLTAELLSKIYAAEIRVEETDFGKFVFPKSKYGGE